MLRIQAWVLIAVLTAAVLFPFTNTVASAAPPSNHCADATAEGGGDTLTGNAFDNPCRPRDDGAAGGSENPCKRKEFDIYSVISLPVTSLTGEMNETETVLRQIAGQASTEIAEEDWSKYAIILENCPGKSPTAYLIEINPEFPSVDELALEATNSVTVTTPATNFNPYFLHDDGRYATLTNAETWVWIDKANWTGHSPRVEAGPVWVEATITPIQIVIIPNDGQTPTKTCDGPGTPINLKASMKDPSPTCSMKFTRQTDGNTWPVEVQVVYSVTWVGFNGTSSVSGTLNNLISAPVTYPLAVLTPKPRLVDPSIGD